MRQSEAAKLVAVMLVAYPSQGAKLSAHQQTTLAEVLADTLGDLSYEQCNAALRVLIQTRPFMPTVAEIRSTAIDLTRGPVRAGGDAWGIVLRAISKHGAYRSPGVDFTLDDAIAARCVEALGWRELCLSENATADRARFIELYDAMATQAKRERQSPMLAAAAQKRRLLEQGPAPIGTAIAKLFAVPEEDADEGA